MQDILIIIGMMYIVVGLIISAGINTPNIHNHNKDNAEGELQIALIMVFIWPFVVLTLIGFGFSKRGEK